MAVNQAGLHYPEHLHHWYSNHDIVRPLAKVRKECGLSGPDRIHSCYHYPEVEKWGHSRKWTSSFGAVQVGLLLGYKRIVLAGIPLDDGGYYYRPGRTNFNREHRKGCGLG